MANHLAVRLLCEDRGARRVVTQEEGHLYNDAGDDCQNLAGLSLIGVAPSEAEFTIEQAQAEHERALASRVKVAIGALSIETPVRRKLGQVFDFEELQRITTWARSENIGLHLDGARLFLGAASTGIPVRRWADLFDTVYVSLWKYLNAGSGAILAGPSDLLDELFHTRRMYGGALVRGWVYAAVALQFLDGFEERFRTAIDVSEGLISRLEGHSAFRIERIPNGSNIFWLGVPKSEPAAFKRRMNERGISLREPRSDGRFIVQVNETWATATAADLFSRMTDAVG